MNPLVSHLSYPLTALYSGLTHARNWMYDNEMFRSEKFDIPVVSVGNLTVGGTGKTPMVLNLAKLFKEQGRNPGIVSRGYGRLSNGYILVHDGSSLLVSVKDAGDEPYLMAQHLGNVPIAVCANRVQGINNLIHDSTVDVILLDDAFQHRRVQRDLNILLFNSQTPISQYKLLPAGRLREPLTGATRADIIIFTKSKSRTLPDIAETLSSITSVPQIFSQSEFSLVKIKSGKISPVKQVPDRSLAFCGIGEPESFTKALSSIGVKPIWTRNFRDHSHYLESDILKLLKVTEKYNHPAVITTFKDLVKLPESFINQVDLYVLDLSIIFSDDDLHVLQELLDGTIN